MPRITGRGWPARLLSSTAGVRLGLPSYALCITRRWMLYALPTTGHIKTGHGWIPCAALFITLRVTVRTPSGVDVPEPVAPRRGAEPKVESTVNLGFCASGVRHLAAYDRPMRVVCRADGPFIFVWIAILGLILLYGALILLASAVVWPVRAFTDRWPVVAYRTSGDSGVHVRWVEGRAAADALVERWAEELRHTGTISDPVVSKS